MSADVRLPALRQRWEAARQRGQALTADDLCRDCPELIAAVRRQLALWQRESAGGQIAQSPTQDGTAGTHGAPSAAVRGADLVLQPGAVPVPGYRLVRKLGQGGFG